MCPVNKGFGRKEALIPVRPFDRYFNWMLKYGCSVTKSLHDNKTLHQ
jgi:hypothetical protein